MRLIVSAISALALSACYAGKPHAVLLSSLPHHLVVHYADVVPIMSADGRRLEYITVGELKAVVSDHTGAVQP